MNLKDVIQKDFDDLVKVSNNIVYNELPNTKNRKKIKDLQLRNAHLAGQLSALKRCISLIEKDENAPKKLDSFEKNGKVYELHQTGSLVYNISIFRGTENISSITYHGTDAQAKEDFEKMRA